MTQVKSDYKKLKKYLWRTFVGVTGGLLLLIGAAYFVSSSDGKDMTADLIRNYAAAEFGMTLDIGGYTVSRTDDFPFLSFAMTRLSVKSAHPAAPHSDLLTIDSLTFKIHPWDLLRNRYNLRDFHLSGAHLHYYRDVEGKSNTDFKGNQSVARETEKDRYDDFSLMLNQAVLEDVRLVYTDDMREKDYDVTFRKAAAEFECGPGHTTIQIAADCHFGGLAFKRENGAYLADKHAHLALNFDVLPDSVTWTNSYIRVKDDRLTLTGSFVPGAVPHLDLRIGTDGIMLRDAASLLDDKIQKILNPFEIDRPLAAQFRLNGPLQRGVRSAIDINFSAADASFCYDAVTVEGADFAGSYSNHCRSTGGVIERGEDCVTVDYIRGKMFDRHEIDLTGVIHDFKTLDLTAAGTALLDMPALQPYLTNTPFRLRQGKAAVKIDYAGEFGDILQGCFLQKEGVDARIEVRDAALDFRGFQFNNLRGNLRLGAQNTEVNNLLFNFKNIPVALNGRVGNVLPYLFSLEGKLRPDVLLTAAEVDLQELLPTELAKDMTASADNVSAVPEKETTTLLSREFSDFFRPIATVMQGKIGLRIAALRYKNLTARDTEFDLIFGAERARELLAVKNLRTLIGDSLFLQADFAVRNAEKPRIFGKWDLHGPLQTAGLLYDNKTADFSGGHFALRGEGDFFTDNLQNLSALTRDLNFTGELSLREADAHLQKPDLKINNLNTEILFNQKNLQLNGLTFNALTADFFIRGEIENYLTLLNDSKEIADANFTVHVPRLDLRRKKTTRSDEPAVVAVALSSDEVTMVPLRSLFKDLYPMLRKMRGRAEVSMGKLKLPGYPFKDIEFVLTADRDAAGKTYLQIADLQAKVFGKSPFFAQISVPDLQNPALDLRLWSYMPIKTLSRIIYNDNFKPKKGNIRTEISYKNTFSDSLNWEHYALDADIKGLLEVENARVLYPPRGLDFSEVNGTIEFDEQRMQIDFPEMRFNRNRVELTGEVNDFLPFFFEENRDFTLDLLMHSPKIDFTRFDTPSTLKNQPETEDDEEEFYDEEEDELTDAEKGFNNAVDRLLEEGRLSLRTRIDTVVYQNFHAENIVGRAVITDNDAVLDTFRMLTADGQFGVNGIISDIDKEEIKLQSELDFTDISAPVMLRAFDDFGQDAMTHENIKGKVNADIRFSALMNDNYEIFPESMSGAMTLDVRDGEFINFAGLTNLKGFLFKNRKLDTVYFSQMHADIQVKGRDMEFDPFLLNTTAATLGVEGVYTFSEEDKTDLLIKVPIGNLFKRYLKRSVIQAENKSRRGFPVYIRVKEKEKELDFRLRLRR